VFDDVLPSVQRGIAAILNLPDPSTITIAPNTHEFLRRLLSCFATNRAIRILTSDAEFHTFRRQVARLEEDGMVACTYISVEPPDTFQARFAGVAANGGHDLVFVSAVFFTTGATCGEVDALVAAVPDRKTFIVIDGYHGFMARPTDLSFEGDIGDTVAGRPSERYGVEFTNDYRPTPWLHFDANLALIRRSSSNHSPATRPPRSAICRATTFRMRPGLSPVERVAQAAIEDGGRRGTECIVLGARGRPQGSCPPIASSALAVASFAARSINRATISARASARRRFRSERQNPVKPDPRRHAQRRRNVSVLCATPVTRFRTELRQP
jgi:hypothetical protein